MIVAHPRCVALVTPAWPIGAQPNGIVSYTSRLTAGFRSLGVEPVILGWEVQEGYSDPRAVDIRDFEQKAGTVTRGLDRIRRVVSTSFVPPQYQRSLLNAFRHAADRFPIEILQMEEAFGHAVGLIRSRRVPIVVRLHGPWFLNGEINGAAKNSEFFQRIAAERKAIETADAITAPSLDVLNQTRAYYELPLPEAVVIPNPIEMGEMGPSWSPSECDRNRIVFVGRFDLHKGADVLIDAFAQVAANRPELKLDFIGPDRRIAGADGRSISLEQYLERNVPADVRTRVHIHGPKRLSEIQEFRRRGFVTVIPSRYETFGNTALEALAVGCPVIASGTGGLAEIVKDGKTGLLVPPADSRKLADALQRILSEPDLAPKLGAAARADVASRYVPRAIASRTLEVYSEVLKSWSTGRNRAIGRS
ncbi:MAG: glycosyltransferase family 4 protein [Planctomycetaceae bacterium]